MGERAGAPRRTHRRRTDNLLNDCIPRRACAIEAAESCDLRSHGHVTVAPDLPVEDDQASLGEYAEVVVDAIGGRSDAAVVAQSFGGYVAPLVAERVNARLIVLVAGMVPAPRESADEMFATTAWLSLSELCVVVLRR